jgi:hypothetical protein
MVFMNCNRLKRTPCANRCNIETLPSRPRILRRYHWMLCALAGGYLVASAQAAMTTIKFQPNSADINDLDHRLVHTRRIDGISLGGFAATDPLPGLGRGSIIPIELETPGGGWIKLQALVVRNHGDFAVAFLTNIGGDDVPERAAVPRVSSVIDGRERRQPRSCVTMCCESRSSHGRSSVRVAFAFGFRRSVRPST